ncbi:hypothetical protein ABBQ32_012261 [Trebouxia sp. C0010 RCD-2024]
MHGAPDSTSETRALDIRTSMHVQCAKLISRVTCRPATLSPAVVSSPCCGGPSGRPRRLARRSCSAVHRNCRHRAMTVAAARQDARLDQAFTLVGSGRVGTALAKLGSGSDKIIERGQPVDGPPGPIIVCTRNDDLQGVLDSTPKDRREDLVFIQNGMLQPWLDARGLGSNTQALVYFAVSKKGEAPIDGKTDANPEGLTAVTGKHAHAFAARLAHGNLSCKVLDQTQYKKSMLEKLIWICAVMLVGAKNGNIKVGEVEKDHKDELSTLISELTSAGEAELRVQLDGGVLERLLAYSRSVASFPTAVKEVPWRNGWFYDISLQAKQEHKDDPCPTHSAWLKDVGAVA